MSFEIHKNEINRFFEYRHTGLIQRDDVGDAWREMLNEKDFTVNGFDILTDYSGGEFAFSIEHTEVIDEFLYSIRHILKGKRQAVVADNPFSTALSMLYASKLYDEIGFSIEVFSTREAAVRWLINS